MSDEPLILLPSPILSAQNTLGCLAFPAPGPPPLRCPAGLAVAGSAHGPGALRDPGRRRRGAAAAQRAGGAAALTAEDAAGLADGGVLRSSATKLSEVERKRRKKL